MTTRAQVVAEARSWVDARTPYAHQGRLKGVGVDCAGIVLLVGVALGLVDPAADRKAYPRGPDGTLRAVCDENLDPIETDAARPGDVLLFRIRREPQHLAILGDYLHGGLSMIHAYADSKRAVEHVLDPSWRKRIVQAYAYRGLSD